MTITVSSQPVTRSSAQIYLESLSVPSGKQSAFREAISQALRGKGAHHKQKIQTHYSLDPCSPVPQYPNQRELSWDSEQVILSTGGVIDKKWSFREEGQCVQWACLGFLQQSGEISSASATAAHLTNHNNGENNRSAFGPFSRENMENLGQRESSEQIVQAVFIFLRSIGKIFLLDGVEYNFSLPFIVRQAWPLYPHGVLIQRVVEDFEYEEAVLTGDPVLPSIFTLTSPFTEVAPAGITTGITPQGSLADEAENCSRPVKSIPASETVLWVSPRNQILLDHGQEVIVTLNTTDRTLQVWSYIHIKAKDTPPPLYDKPPPAPAATPDSDDTPPLASLPTMAPSLTNKVTMASIAAMEDPPSPTPAGGKQKKVRHDSLTRNDLSVTMDRMALGTNVPEYHEASMVESGRMKTVYWMERKFSLQLTVEDFEQRDQLQFALWDSRYDGTYCRALLGVLLPAQQRLDIFAYSQSSCTLVFTCPALSIAPVLATRARVADLVVVRLDGSLEIFTCLHCSISFAVSNTPLPLAVERDGRRGNPVLQDAVGSCVTLALKDSSRHRVCLDLVPTDSLTTSLLELLALTLDSFQFLLFHGYFLEVWSSHGFTKSQDVELNCFRSALYQYLGLEEATPQASGERAHSTDKAAKLHRYARLYSLDPALRNLRAPFPQKPTPHVPVDKKPHPMMTPILHNLHLLAEDMRLDTEKYEAIRRVTPIICKLALIIRPEWADYWNRLCPGSSEIWPTPTACNSTYIDDRLPSWPEDFWAMFYGRLNFPDWKPFTPTVFSITNFFKTVPSFAYGWTEPLKQFENVFKFYAAFVDESRPPQTRPGMNIPSLPSSNSMNDRMGTPSVLDPAQASSSNPSAVPRPNGTHPAMPQRSVNHRAEAVVQTIVTTLCRDTRDPEIVINQLPLGIAAPLREAARTCQLIPPGNWPAEMYQFIGRNDLAENVNRGKLMTEVGSTAKEGWKSRKQIISQISSNGAGRRSICSISGRSRALLNNDDFEPPSGVDLDLQEFTDIRFGQDRRLEEVARMLCSSRITLLRSPERSDLNEHDQAKEHQALVIRVAERTLSLAYGRAMFTFGSIPSVHREAYIIPKLNFTVRTLPLNITATAEPAKLGLESASWGEFHNGVAAALRISPSAKGVEGTWISYNKPTDLTPEHAGFLYGLGLTGHLKQMLPWNAFEYLSPKHQPTSIGVLLGLAATNVGNSHKHVTKLLAVHTPALLPTPDVDLNVPLITQAAGLSGIGILYLGTRHRRMAEVALGEISRKDLSQPDASNEHREAYTLSAALAFGMIMLGLGSSIPADMELVSRLTYLIHGDESVLLGHKSKANFDINLTSPAATMALGLMYMRTERKDIAAILSIPENAIALNRIQPSFLLVRTLARSLILWDAIRPDKEWMAAQLTDTLRRGREKQHLKGPRYDEAYELGYFNILAASCFAIGLKYAGTASQEAYTLIVSYFDLFTRVVHSAGTSQFHLKVRRAAVRESLNLLSISLCLIMAGTGEITCLRRLRYAYGLYMQAPRYGVHFATNASIGLLFMGGGRYTLGTSNAAIAALVTAFFPRTHHTSSDNKSFLQALRHLWALAVEPRCLIARDVDTSEIVYLPIKITVQENDRVSLTQLISPTLIPDLDKLQSIRVDTPRYWPFLLNIKQVPLHRERLLRTQTLYVKRRTAFLSYTEDPRGSRSLFVRSASSAGDAATLDFPQVDGTSTHPAGDLSEFITSFSNDIVFLAFADHFCRHKNEGNASEKIFQKYCYATLLDSILQDKPQTLQSHLQLFQCRMMSPNSPYFNLRLQDLRFAVDFYGRAYDHRFSGTAENNPRPSLLRHTTVSGVLHSLDEKLKMRCTDQELLKMLKQYVNGELVVPSETKERKIPLTNILAWYLVRNGVPTSSLLVVLKSLAQDAHTVCSSAPPPDGTTDTEALAQSIKEVVHTTGSRMSSSWGNGWSRSSLEEVIGLWNLSSS